MLYVVSLLILVFSTVTVPEYEFAKAVIVADAVIFLYPLFMMESTNGSVVFVEGGVL